MNLEILANLNNNPDLKNKEFFTITEVSNLTNINTHILRYWEKNGLMTPIKIHNGQRRYNAEHINLIFRLKDLIYDQKIGIKGAKKIVSSRAKTKKIQGNQTEASSQYNENVSEFLETLKKELKAIAKLLK
jgi:DNA-binding transcriptional MerR regulator